MSGLNGFPRRPAACRKHDGLISFTARSCRNCSETKKYSHTNESLSTPSPCGHAELPICLACLRSKEFSECSRPIPPLQRQAAAYSCSKAPQRLDMCSHLVHVNAPSPSNHESFTARSPLFSTSPRILRKPESTTQNGLPVPDMRLRGADGVAPRATLASRVQLSNMQ